MGCGRGQEGQQVTAGGTDRQTETDAGCRCQGAGAGTGGRHGAGELLVQPLDQTGRGVVRELPAQLVHPLVGDPFGEPESPVDQGEQGLLRRARGVGAGHLPSVRNAATPVRIVDPGPTLTQPPN